MNNINKLAGLVLGLLKAFLYINGGLLVIFIGMIIGLIIRFDSIAEFQQWILSLSNIF